jgi:ATP-dependent RNA helicase DeaD
MTATPAFNELGLAPELLDAIDQKGFEEPTAIQAMTIPVMLGNDTNIIAQAQTGTGKTAAFGLPLLQMIDARCKSVQALVLVPTRELAIQVSEEINSLKQDTRLTIVPIYGGQSLEQQVRRLKKGVHIVVGTPGRVIDHLHRKTLRLGDIQYLILDEADEMLNMGFIEDIDEIIRHTNADKRMLLFSATMPKRIRELAHTYMAGYEFLSVRKQQLTTHLTEQIYFEVKSPDKFEALCRIIDMEDEFYGLIFCRTRRDVDALSAHLLERGYEAEAIHGEISQSQRERTLGKFRKRRINILVATDVAARGIDVNDLTHVINYALPQDPESYVHRIGRTGRAGKQGTAITFITPGEYKRLMVIQRNARTDIKKRHIPRVRDIIQAKQKKIHDDLTLLLNEKTDSKYRDWAGELLADHDPTDVLGAMLHYFYEKELDPGAYTEIDQVASANRELDQQGTTRLFVALGKKDKINRRKLVDMISKRVHIKPAQIRDVQVLDSFSFITVPFGIAEKIIVRFKEKGQKPLVTHARKPSGKTKHRKRTRAMIR